MQSTAMENPLERRLNISVPLQQIEGEVGSRLKRLARTVKLPGFRPGKVPVKMVEKQYGPRVRQEVLEDELKKSFGEAIRGQNLRIAGSPRFDANPLPEGAQTYEYSVTFEIYPEVSVGNLSGATVTRPALQVSDAEINKTIETLRKQRGEFETAERAAAKGDQVTFDFRGTVDGAEFEGGQAKDFSVVLGEGRLLQEFETQLAGMRAGDSKSFEMRFPDSYHGKHVAGKIARFEIAVRRVAARKLPEVNAEFAQAFGIADGDLGKMRAEIKANLELEVKRRIQARLKEQVMQALLDTTQLTLPQSLVVVEKQRLAQAMHEDMAAQGANAGNMPPDDAIDAQAKHRVGLGLILAEIVKLNGLHAKPEQVRAVVEDFAQSYEHPEQVVQWYYQSPERLSDAESLALENNVVEWVLGRCKVKEQPIAFDELMGNEQHA